MLGTKQPQRNKIYLNIKKGQIVRRTETGEECFDYVDGRLVTIMTRERRFRGEATLYWYIDLRDEETSDIYSLGLPYTSNVFKSIILQLATADGFGNIRIAPYSKNGYDKAQVYAGGVKLNWATKDLPPLREVTIGGRVVKDDTERMNLIREYVNGILSRLNTPTK